MPNNYLNKAHVQQRDPLLAQALDSIVQMVQNVATQTASNLAGFSDAPPPITALTVLASAGVFDIQIQDNAPVNRGINYFVEYSLSPNFASPIVIDLGASRNYRAYWGNQTLYFRAFSQYLSSAPSPTVYFGAANSPTAVVGGGSAGPTPQASTGSGTASNDGQQGGAGFGYNPSRGRNNVL